MREKLYTTTAIVLSSRQYLESDALITFLSPKWGKISAIAKGVRKTKSKRAGALQPFSEIKVQLYRGRTLDTVTQVESKKSHIKIIESYERTLAAHAACEMVFRIIREQEESEELYRVISTFLSIVEDKDEPTSIMYALAMQILILALTGYDLSVDRCVNCSKNIENIKEISYVDAERGGFVCGSCNDGKKSRNVESDKKIIKILISLYGVAQKIARKSSVAEVIELLPIKQEVRRIKKKDVYLALEFLEKFTEYHTGIQLKANADIKEMLK